MSQDASLTEIMRYFEYKSMEQFRKDWGALSEEDKTFFKQGVGAIIHNE